MPGRRRRRKFSLTSCPAEEGAHLSFWEKRTLKRKGGREGGRVEGWKVSVSYLQHLVSNVINMPTRIQKNEAEHIQLSIA